MNVLSEELRLQAEVLKSLTITLAAILLSTNLTPISKQHQTEIESENLSEYRIQLVEPLEPHGFTEHATVKQIPKPAVKSQQKASVKPTGDKYSWMQQAGIPESDWQYVDYIVTKESSWNPNARGKLTNVMHNGRLIQDRACGLAQSLPCSKVGSNWNDPVVSLKWQHGYVKGRYGSYKQAYAFWLKNKWY